MKKWFKRFLAYTTRDKLARKFSKAIGLQGERNC